MKDQIDVRYFGPGTMTTTDANGKTTSFEVKDVRIQTDVSEKAVPPQARLTLDFKRSIKNGSLSGMLVIPKRQVAAAVCPVRTETEAEFIDRIGPKVNLSSFYGKVGVPFDEPLVGCKLPDDFEKLVSFDKSINHSRVDYVEHEMRLAAIRVQSIHGVRKLQRIIKPYQRQNSPWVALKHVPTENHKALLRTLTEATMIVPSDVNRLNELIERISQPLGSEAEPLVDRLIAAGDNLLSEHAQETDHFVIAIREYQAAIRELLK